MPQIDTKKKNYNPIFIKNLKYLIKRDSVKQVDLAKAINKVRSAISNYLVGDSNPDWETLDAIADFFHVNSEDLRKKDLRKDGDGLKESKEPTSYQAAVFLPQLSGRASLFHSDNLEGTITSPFPFCSAQRKDAKLMCYAVNLGNDSISSCGVTKKSLAIFQRDEKAVSGDLVAVYFKDDDKISIRKITIKTHEYIFSSDKGDVVISKKDAKQTFKLLGKVVKVMINL